MENNPKHTALSEKDIDELLRKLFLIDEKEECMDDIKERLWGKVEQRIEASFLKNKNNN